MESDTETEDDLVTLESQVSTRLGEPDEYKKNEPFDDEHIVYV
jgi:hypothetical protein